MNRRAALVLLTLILLFRNSFLQKKGEGRLRRLFTIYDLQDARRPRIGRTRSGREGRLDNAQALPAGLSTDGAVLSQDARRPRVGRTRSGREGRLDKSAAFARRVRRQCGADESIYDFR